MVSIVINGQDADSKQLEDFIGLAQASGAEVLVIAKEQPQAITTEKFIASDSTPYKQLMSASKQASSNHMLVLDARLELDQAGFQQLVDSFSDNDSDIAIAQLSDGNESVELPNLTIEDLITSVSSYTEWPLMAISVSKNSLSEFPIIEAQNMKVLLGRMIIQANSLAMEVAILAPAVTANNAMALASLTAEESAKLLEYAVNSYNIEELFPNHAWDTYSEEAAAACYHTLAAKFIKFNDFEAAKQCLSFSDSLEDSPRSQALKAIISVNQGETLGAVANLVSSLQQYEVRKANKEEKVHYLSFIPENLEEINTNLHQGLSALNKRDNETALQHFATAVFNFDSFYNENGVDSIE